MTERAVSLPLLRTGVGLGVACMLLGDLLFALNDVMGKWLVATYSVGQVMLLRSFAALVVLAPVLWRVGWRRLVHVDRPGLHLLRTGVATAELLCFYVAVIDLPVADVMTFYLAGPIYVAALSPFILGERVTARGWAAILAGFAGVLIALAPSAAALTPAAGIALLGSFAFAIVLVQNRQLRATPDVTLVVWQTVGALLAGLALAPIGWVTPSAGDFALLSLLGVVAMVAHLFINRALKLAPAAVVAPLQYTLLLWAVVFGWLFFGDVPGPAMLAGSAVIIGAGLVLIERRRPPTEPIEPG